MKKKYEKLVSDIKLLIKQTRAEMKQEQKDYERRPNEDDFAVGYIRALELKIQDLKELIK